MLGQKRSLMKQAASLGLASAYLDIELGVIG
jgi:hypothetical protein